MKYIITLWLSLFALSVQAQTPPPDDGTKTQLLLNMQVPCSEQGIDYLSDIVNKHG